MRKGLASYDVMNSESSYALNRARFFVIGYSIGILALLAPAFPALAGTRSNLAENRWKPLRSEKDILLLRNQPNHLIEGTGGAGMLLGETETELRQRYGEPAYRNHAQPETLSYTEELFNAEFVLQHDRIIEIRLEVAKHKSPSLAWFTALGLHENDLTGRTAAEAETVLRRFYRTGRVRVVGDRVDVYGRGIGFDFYRRAVIKVRIFRSENYAASPLRRGEAEVVLS